MITEIVLFNLPEGMTREQVVPNYRQTTQKWRANPHLIRKNYLFNGEARQGGGVYLLSGGMMMRGGPRSSSFMAASLSSAISRRRSWSTTRLKTLLRNAQESGKR